MASAEYFRNYRASGKLKEYERDRSRRRRANETPEQRKERLLRHKYDNRIRKTKTNYFGPLRYSRLIEFERIKIKKAIWDFLQRLDSPITNDSPLPLPLIEVKRI